MNRRTHIKKMWALYNEGNYDALREERGKLEIAPHGAGARLFYLDFLCDISRGSEGEGTGVYFRLWREVVKEEGKDFNPQKIIDFLNKRGKTQEATHVRQGWEIAKGRDIKYENIDAKTRRDFREKPFPESFTSEQKQVLIEDVINFFKSWLTNRNIIIAVITGFLMFLSTFHNPQ